MGCGGLFDDDGLLFAIFDFGGAGEDAGFGVDGVAQRYVNLARNIFKLDINRLWSVLRGADEVKD